MLISLVDGYEIDYIPHSKEFYYFKNRLSDEEFNLIVKELNSRIDTNEIHTSSWMPGSDWTGTVYEPIYTKACKNDFENSAKFFGLILWYVIMNRPEKWSFGRYYKNEIPIRGLTYFRIDL
ncbi:MAG: hypothetical protein BWY23_02359 [Spirochaetes bacterium ADurb.Bin218]|nr:MAG: hypothetical protein BWY23_02359 [Spirochaetes bacterium ADurb.Bin218]